MSTPFLPPIATRFVRDKYTVSANGPFVGKRCQVEGCDVKARFVTTPLGDDPLTAGHRHCARHLPSAIPLIMDEYGRSVIVQEIPVMARYRGRGRPVHDTED